jgi:hypothetical protein
LLQHRDKNLALMLPLWDLLFGTLYVPEKREIFLLGISNEEIGARNPHTNIGQALLEPIRTGALTLRRQTRQGHAEPILDLPPPSLSNGIVALTASQIDISSRKSSPESSRRLIPDEAIAPATLVKLRSEEELVAQR